MRTSRTIENGLADLLSLIGVIVARGAGDIIGQDDAELRKRAEHDVEVAVEAMRRLVVRLDLGATAHTNGRPRTDSLTTRERFMADMLCGGKSYKDIANALDLSVLSVQSRVKQIYMKLAVHSKAELRSLLVHTDTSVPPAAQAHPAAQLEQQS